MPSNTTIPETTRSHEERIALAASPDVVWRAIADAEELVNWFPLDAEVTPGKGGSVSLAWGEFWKGTSAIEVWEPNRRLRTVERRTDGAGRVVEIAVDYFIEGQGGDTVLRVVHSGFGPGAEWDEEFDSIGRGWKLELRNLRHYLARHRGTPRRVAWAWAKTSLPAEQCYARLMGPAGLVREGSVAGLREGDPYRVVAATGDVFQGVVITNDPPRDFAGTVAALNDGIVRFWAEVGTASIWISTWGVGESIVRGLDLRWQDQVRKALEV